MADNLVDRLQNALANRYAIELRIGQGGMAIVFLARDIKHERPVAIKMLRPELAASLGPDRFLREIKIMSRLTHPHILPLLDSGEVNGLLYYVMPYVEGESLRDRLNRERQLPIDDALGVARDVADALHYAHEHDVVHRDIKPENILFEAGHAVVTDFGVARAVSVAGGEKLTETGMAVGTPAYMSPEQITGGDDVDGRSDLYSLACVLYEMLSGQPPFDGATAQAIFARHSLDPVPSIRNVRTTVPDAIEHIVGRALAKTPADRFATAAEFKNALSDYPRITTRVGTPRTRRLFVRAAIAVVALVAIAVALQFARGSPAPELDRNRIMVYPLVTPTEGTATATFGEDVATMIGHALDGRGPLRWIDGWQRLEQDQRNDIRTLTQQDARALARRGECGHYVTGRVVIRGDTADVFLELWDVEGDSTIARANASGVANEAWRLGLSAVNGLLPALVPTDEPDPWRDWANRAPAAVAAFLLGESEFRRGQFENAFRHYREALRTDSGFAIAAIRGAQAASWSHRHDEAVAFIRVAFEFEAQLPEKWRHFARGFDGFATGHTTEALAALRRAVDIDPDMAVAWWQMGDLYTHLMVTEGRPDSLAEAALSRAYEIDSTSANVLFHLLEYKIRKGELERAAPLLVQFKAGNPEMSYVRQFDLMFRCVEQGPDVIDWRSAVFADPEAAALTANKFAVGGAQLACAERGLQEVISADTSTGDAAAGRQWSAVLGLLSVFHMQDRTADLSAFIDTVTITPYEAFRPVLPLLASIAGADLPAKAQQAVDWHEEQYGKRYERATASSGLMILGTWLSHQGDLERATWAADRMQQITQQTGLSRDSLRYEAVVAHIALARGDTANAFDRLHGLVHTPLGREINLAWGMVTSLPYERLTFAELLRARGDPAEAITMASIFDSPAAQIFQLYLPASLELRLRAANALGDRRLVRYYESRLARLAGVDS